MDLSKNNSFSAEEAKTIFFAPRKERRYQYMKYLSSLIHDSNFIMETEDNSIQRHLYDYPIV